MILSELKIHFLRTLHLIRLELNPRFNFVSGPNGSGKTSLLEALYLLSCGHSFRSREIAPIITQGQSTLTVFARGQNEDMISIQKSSTDATQIKLNNQPCTSTSQLAYALPCQIIYSDIFQIIDAGATERRSVLDWGLFHVKHDYLGVWKEYKRVLKQRNALLKTKASYQQFIPWDQQLSQLAEQLDALRSDYCSQWHQAFIHVLEQLTTVSCMFTYSKGWDKKNTGKSLAEILEEQFHSDLQKSYTQSGAHQADILIESSDTKAKHILSRGQQKIILIALKLSQADLLKKHCLYLIDDLAAELDQVHQDRLLTCLANREGQYVITSTQNSSLMPSMLQNQMSCFSIKEGHIGIS